MTMLTATARAFAPLPYRADNIRDYVFPVVSALAVFFLPNNWIMIAFIIIGQAHFLIAYLYQYKGKKMNARYGIIAGALLVLGILYFSFGFGIQPLLLSAGALFSAHFALDEFTLHGESLTKESIATIAGFATLFTALILTVVFPTLTSVGIYVGVLMAVAVVARVALRRGEISRAERYLVFVAVILFFFAVIVNIPQQVLGIILLLHFANWYVGYGKKLQGTGESERFYWKAVIVTLLISAGLFLLFILLQISQLKYLFELQYYYAWAALHIILSFVTATYRLQKSPARE